jgi:hypothetical protein
VNRRSRIAALVVGIAACVALLPWGEWSGVPFENVARSRLEQRVARYQELRRKDDWPALYEMTAPGQRRRVDRQSFLGLYGLGVLRIHRIDTKAIEIDTAARTALVAMTTVGELVPEKLPAQFRKVRVDDPAGLRQVGDIEIAWVWDDGEWYFQMDREVVAGVDGKGRAVIPAVPK